MRRVKRLALIGRQNSGKTTVVEAMVRYWDAHNLRVGVIKHDGHLLADDADDWEKPNSDTARYQAAGAALSLLAGGGRSMLRMSQDTQATDVLGLCERLEAMAETNSRSLDVVLVEGFKASSLPKLIVVRRMEDITWLNEGQSAWSSVLAVVCPMALRHLVEVDVQVYDDSHIPLLCTNLWHQL